MARKSIFDIASASITLPDEVDRIVTMSTKENILQQYNVEYTLFDYVNKVGFRDWKHRGHFINVKDFLKAIKYDEILKSAKNENIDAFMSLIELTYNFWHLSYLKLVDDRSSTYWQNNYFHLRNVMLDNLEKYNHKAYVNDDMILVIEDKPEVTAVAEIVEVGLALDIIRYNHRSLQGEIDAKKAILLSLGAELEPRRKELQSLNKQLSEDIFFMLNNLNLRHNNRSKKDKNYKEAVAKMRKDRLEKWYDELYQMILLAMLLLDNVDRTAKVKDLKDKITGESNNG